MVDVRPSPIAGTWYEGDAKRLSRNIDEYLDNANLPELDGDVMAVIAPHAGHRYSGEVAGCAFAAMRGREPDLVVVVAPMHHPYYEPLLTTAHDAYRTPLGDIPVDRNVMTELNVALQSELGYGLVTVSNDPEHSLEIELPFLQRALKSDWKLLPIMVRVQDSLVSEALGIALAKVLKNKNFVLVASTDLSHFYDQNTAVRYDRAMMDTIEAFDPEAAFALEREGKGFACGLGAFTSVLWAAREMSANRVKILRHATSGDVTGDYSSVVGYGAAVVLVS
ncbi:MAG TPA: AmmeMemoRadiSam system protein B [Anaerolineales bacterium]|nr:AmmeMemoRadiSam system protein B [Anaerolineales bacterium]